MKAFNIKWDTDNNAKLLSKLPKEIEIPKEIEHEEDKISNYLTDITGYCHKGFYLTSDIE